MCYADEIKVCKVEVTEMTANKTQATKEQNLRGCKAGPEGVLPWL